MVRLRSPGLDPSGISAPGAEEFDHREHHQRDLGRYKIIFIVGIITLISELVGSWLTNSLALFSDAFHVLVDLGAVTTVIIIEKKAIETVASNDHDAQENKLRRIGGLIQIFLLCVALIWILKEAIGRIGQPPIIASGPMLFFAGAGLVLNGISLLVLRHEHCEENINENALGLHIFSDLLSSFLVIAGGVIMYFTHWFAIDVVLSLIIGVFIGSGIYRLIKRFRRK